MLTSELDFDLPGELIAQDAQAQRGQSRLLHYQRCNRQIEHLGFDAFVSLVKKGDLLVFNDAKVLPARFYLRKPTGGRVEGLFLDEAQAGRWRVLLKKVESYRGPLQFESAPETGASVAEDLGEGEYVLEVSTLKAAWTFLERVGRMPLPPYIKRDKFADERDESDKSRYQTVYARAAGSVAAPTAGLHFSQEDLLALDSAGIERTFVTLHVGMGTFKPVSARTLDEHRMHSEGYEIGEVAADALNRAVRDGRRIVAIGTTSARVLESQPEGQLWKAGKGTTSIFIQPGYAWKHTRALLTNFHLPRSTLIALVAAFVGLGEQRRIYREAIERKYRFYSYGDAMFCE